MRLKFLLLCLIAVVIIPQLFAVPHSSSLAIIAKHPIILVGCFSFALAGYLYFLARLAAQAGPRNMRIGCLCAGIFVLLLVFSPYLAGQGRLVWVYDTWKLKQRAKGGDPIAQIRMATRTLLLEPDREKALPAAMHWIDKAGQNGIKGTDFYHDLSEWFLPNLYGTEEYVLTITAHNLGNSDEIRSGAICALNEAYPLSTPDERRDIDRSILRMFHEFHDNPAYLKGLTREAVAILEYAKVRSEPKPKKPKRSTPYFRNSYSGPEFQKLHREMRSKLEQKIKERESKLVSPY
ncbi:hypothetical protein [Maridesulfovibrio sp.]|uniref:hypothetical protein n=1 Tax=Maridesulfovibrio sp. TaxID=2795000 RepID=UPI002A188833|nr:hypothetical protein [Maridesulfovibrio sp.]